MKIFCERIISGIITRLTHLIMLEENEKFKKIYLNALEKIVLQRFNITTKLKNKT